MNIRPPSPTRQKIDRILQSKLLLHTCQNLNDVYTLIQQLSNDVLDLYPHIACRTQCNTCCKGTSMPVVSPAEWAILHDYILRYWQESDRHALIQRAQALYQQHRTVLWLLHDNIQQESDTEKLQEFVKLLPLLAETQCPFLVNETCSAYAGRPAKCRAHGTFLFVFQEHTQLHACQSEVDKMEVFMQTQGSRNVVMPVWNPFDEKIVKDLNPPGRVSTLLVLWVISHLENGKISETCNLSPDFQTLRNQLPEP
jgi:Fe-S-cluster containining protein